MPLCVCSLESGKQPSPYGDYGNITEYDKLYQNRNKISKVDRGSSMKQEGCKRLELKQNGMQVILEFPRNSEQEEKIKREVKEILSGILREYLIKNSITSQKS